MISFANYENATWRVLTAYEKLVHHYLANRAYKDGETYVSVEKIAEDLNIDRKTVISATTILHKKGFIVKDSTNKRKTVYRMREESVPPDGTNQSVPPHGTNTAISTVSGIGLVPPDGTLSKRKYKRKSSLFSESSFEYRLASKLWKSIYESGTSQKAPDLQKWATTFDLMHRLDNRPFDFINVTMTKAREDGFWKQNLRSPETLRKHLNAGKLDKFTPAEGEYDTDQQLAEHDAKGAA